MNFPSKEVLDMLKEYESLPLTDERNAINDSYLNDDIGSFEFQCKAREYLNRIKEECES